MSETGDSKKTTKPSKPKKNGWFIFFLILFIVLIPLWVCLIVNNSIIGLSEKPNEIGDAIGGITSPIIGIGGIILTFCAFYIQYKFNREQSKLIADQRNERIEDKIQTEKESNFNYLSSEFLRIENKVLSFNDSSLEFGNRETVDTTKFEFQKIINEITYIITIINNLIRLTDLKRVDKYKSENIFIDKYDRIILSNIYFLHKSIFENCLKHFVIILTKARLLNYISDEDHNIINYKNEREELKISIATIHDILFTVYPYIPETED